jgi:hypothetical protein
MEVVCFQMGLKCFAVVQMYRVEITAPQILVYAAPQFSLMNMVTVTTWPLRWTEKKVMH